MSRGISVIQLAARFGPNDQMSGPRVQNEPDAGPNGDGARKSRPTHRPV